MTKSVAIIGAGISGLAHADVLTRCGFSVVLFDRAERLGGVWACSYPEVRLQNTWAGYHLSSFPWPFQPDQHPTSAQICRYLEALVAARGFDVRLRHEVVAAPEAPSGGWDVRVRRRTEDGGPRSSSSTSTISSCRSASTPRASTASLSTARPTFAGPMSDRA